MESQPSLQKSMTRSLFIESLVGNIKEKYFFEKKLGSGGYGAVYLAKNKITGKFMLVLLKIEEWRNGDLTLNMSIT